MAIASGYDYIFSTMGIVKMCETFFNILALFLLFLTKNESTGFTFTLCQVLITYTGVFTFLTLLIFFNRTLQIIIKEYIAPIFALDLANTIVCTIYYFTVMTVFGFVGENTDINEMKMAVALGCLNTICYSIDIISIIKGWGEAYLPLTEYTEIY